jgi:golgi SNAP receptor complex member 2
MQHTKSMLDTSAKQRNFSAFQSQQRTELLGSANHNSSNDLELEMAENGSLSRSSQLVNNYIEVGKETLNELVSQRERLKSIQRRVLDMFNYLGLSNSLMKGIENRDNIDKWIVFAGMIIVLVIIFLVYKFLRK